jgi:endonuclease/exonuclease/phosphatase (EEP) superfamily protein YafD
MGNCESMLHTFASYIGSPKILDYAFTRDITQVSEAQVHSAIQTTDHAPISIKVNGLRIVSWNIEGLCRHSERESLVKKDLVTLQQMFPTDKVLFLLQEIFLKHDAQDIQTIVKQRMKKLLPRYVFISDGFTGGIAIPEGVQYGTPQFIDRPNSRKKCISLKVTYRGISTNIVNIHLKSVVLRPFNRVKLQRTEMQNILDRIHGPALFMGDFNTSNPEALMTKKRSKSRKHLEFLT